MADFNLSVTAATLNDAIAKANNAAPQSTTYTKTQVDTALAGKQDTLTTAQQAAADSGITSAKVTQYDKNSTALVETVDSGAKNLLHFDKLGNGGTTWGNTYTHNGITYTLLADGTVSAYGTADEEENSVCYLGLNGSRVNFDDLCDGTHVVSGCPSGGSTSTWRMYVTKTGYGNYSETGNGLLLPDRGSYSDIYLACFVSKSTTIPQSDPIIFKPMICAKAVWDVSQKYVPYCPSMAELYEMIKALQT